MSFSRKRTTKTKNKSRPFAWSLPFFLSSKR